MATQAPRRWMIMVVLGLSIGMAPALTSPATTSPDKRISKHETDAVPLIKSKQAKKELLANTKSTHFTEAISTAESILTHKTEMETAAAVPLLSKEAARAQERNKAQESRLINKSGRSVASTTSATSLETTGGSRRNGAKPFKFTGKTELVDGDEFTDLKIAVDIWCRAAKAKDPATMDQDAHVAAGNAATEEEGYGPIEEWDVSQITDMSWLFEDQDTCNPPIGSWDVSQVINMNVMFKGANVFNQNLNNWTVSQVTNMWGMFYGAKKFDQPLNNWTVGRVTNMEAMFKGASEFNQNLNNWKVDQAKGMYEMFQGASAFDQLLCWDIVGKYTDSWLEGTSAAHIGPEGMKKDSKICAFPGFKSKQILQGAVKAWCRNETEAKKKFDDKRIEDWNVSEITDMSLLFAYQETCNPPIGKWEVGQVEDMDGMFKGAKKFNGDISSWVVSKVTTMREMFAGAKKFNQNINNWVVSKVTTMYEMFAGASAFNGDISSWKVSQVKGMFQMFKGATAFNQLLCWDISKASSGIRIDWLQDTAAFLLGPGGRWSGFERSGDSGVCALNLTTQPFAPFPKELLKYAARRWCSNPTETEATFGPIGTWNVSEITDMSELFKDQATCNPNVTRWKVNKVTNMNNMFQGASAFNQLLCWDTEDKSTYSWLEGTSAANIGPMNDSKVCEFTGFKSKQILQGAVEAWCRNETETEKKFGGKRIGEWDVSEVTDMSYLFANQATCNPPIGTWNVGKVENMWSMFDGASAFNQNLNCWDVGQVKDMNWMFWGASNFSQTLCWDTSGKSRLYWLEDTNGAKSVPAGLCGVLNPEGQCEDKGIWHNNWIPILLGLAATAAVLVAVLVKVDSEDQLDEPRPTLWEQIKTALARVTGLDDQKLSADFDRRRSDSSVVQIHTASPTEAYTVIQALSTTSSGTLTQMVVQQLQATNYTGPMPTMITAVVQSVTNAGSSSDSGSDNKMILIAVVVAAVCLLLALLVIGALVYLWKRNTQPVQNQEQATPHEITMGSVGVSMNPMHAAATKPLE